MAAAASSVHGTHGASNPKVRERATIGAFILAMITFAVIGALVYREFGRFGDEVTRVQRTHRVITALERLLGDLRDVETGQRGFLLTGRPEFLEPYESSVAVVRHHFEELVRVSAAVPDQRQRLEELRPLVDGKLAFSDRTIRMFRGGDEAGARDLVASRRGKILMDSIRRQTTAITEEIQERLASRTRNTEIAAVRTHALLAFGNAFAFALLTTGTILLGRELNRRRRLEEELGFASERESLRISAEHADRRLATVLDELPVGVAVVEAPDGRLILENARMRELLCGTLAEGLSFRTRGDDEDEREAADPLRRTLHTGDRSVGEELTIAREHGGDLRVIANTAPVRERDGRVTAAVGVFQDATDLHRAEEERREAMRFRDVFLTALGHDLRNPLSVITAGSASLAPRVGTDVERNIVRRMASSARRMARMVDQLIDLTQEHLGGGMPITRERMDLGELARTVLDAMEVQHADRRFVLTTRGELMGHWDRARLADVVRNLVENALEHGVADSAVTLDVHPVDGAVELAVHNVGNPIPADLEALIFDPFRRADERKRTKSAGLGVGLYLAQHIVHAHGGRIELESSAETGTTFRVVLPVSHG